MPSDQDHANRLRVEIDRAISSHVPALEQELQGLQDQVTQSIAQLADMLEPVRHLEVPALDVIIKEAVHQATQKPDVDTQFLSHFIRECANKETQEEILSHLLDGAAHFAPRVVLFVARGEEFMGWATRGFSEIATQKIVEASVPREESDAFRKALESHERQTVADISTEPRLSNVFSGEMVAPWHVFPLNALQKTVAILLVAHEPDSTGDSDSVYLQMRYTELLIENLALKILSEMSVPAHGVSQGSATTASEEATSSPRETTHGIDDRRAGEAEEEGPTEDAESTTFETPVPLESPEGPPSESLEGSSDLDTRAAGHGASESDKLHSDAKRFARLLVSEIKLYNEKRVSEGRESKDIYVRLKRDIDRSREMYQKRVSLDVSREFDYLHDELVRILAENNASNLGAEYPGPWFRD